VWTAKFSWRPYAVGTESLVTRTALAVRGTGSALPGPPLSTPELLRRTARYLPPGGPALALRIAKRLGIVNRHMVRSFLEPQETPRAEDSAPKLASRALSAALCGGRCDVKGVRMLIGHTTTPHTVLPGNIAWVAEDLGYCGAHVELRQACSGFAAATLLGASLTSIGIDPVAIVGSETGSVFLDPRHLGTDKSQFINLVQMGDGAGAILLSPLLQAMSARIELSFYGSLDGHFPPGISMTQGGSGFPHGKATRTPHFVQDFEAVRTRGVELLRAGLRIAVEAGVLAESIDWWIVHPANGRMADYAAKLLQLPEEKVVCEAAELGNLGSAAIWVALDRLRHSGKLALGDRVMVLGAEASKYMFGGFLYVHGPQESESS
jgi:3-oxoacyl-[acyl-carrier-protein] synthase-3